MRNVSVLDEEAISAEDSGIKRANKPLDQFLFEQTYPGSSANDGAENIVFLCPKETVGAVHEKFGKAVRFEEIPPLSPDAFDSASWKIGGMYERMIRVTAYASQSAMIEFAFRHGPYIIIEKPTRIKDALLRELDDMKKLQTASLTEKQ